MEWLSSPHSRIGLILVLFVCAICLFSQLFAIQASTYSNLQDGSPSAEHTPTQSEFNFSDREELYHYAYMDLESATEEEKERILAARKKIICNAEWAADDVNVYVVDSDGNVKEELPHFSELFPSDWKAPSLY